MSFVPKGKWLIALGEKFHVVEAESDFIGTVKISIDSNVIFNKWVFILNFRFNIDTHVLRVKEKFGLRGSYYLLEVDDTEYEASDAIVLTTQMSESPLRQSNNGEIQVVNENNVQETMHIVDTEDFPLDNSAGMDVLQIDHEISKTVSNELTINTGSNFGGTLDIGLLNAIKAEISANLQKSLGQKISEVITRRQTLHFTVPAKSSVTYIIIWKRKSRSAECTVFAKNKLYQLNYKANYDLTYEVKSK